VALARVSASSDRAFAFVVVFSCLPFNKTPANAGESGASVTGYGFAVNPTVQQISKICCKKIYAGFFGLPAGSGPTDRYRAISDAVITHAEPCFGWVYPNRPDLQSCRILETSRPSSAAASPDV